MDFSTIINFDSFSQLVPLVHESIIAGLILGAVSYTHLTLPTKA